MPNIGDKVLRTKLVQSIAANLKKLPGGSKPLIKATHLAKDDVISHARVNNIQEKTEIIKDLIEERGTGTILDLPISVGKMLPGVKKILPDDKYRNLLYAYQSKLVDADKAAGKAIASKGKLLNKIFTTTDMVPDVNVITKDNKVVPAFVPKEVARLSAPIDKTKNFALPMLGLYGVDRVISGKKEERTATELRQALIEKVASAIMSLEPAPEFTKEAIEKISRASDLLKQASDKIHTLETDNERLATEVMDLKLQIFAKERSRKATKLANEMISKGLIKQSALASQVDYIMGLDEEGFKVLNKTVGDVPVRTAISNVDAVEKLSCLLTDPYVDNVPEQSSLEEAIIRLSK